METKDILNYIGIEADNVEDFKAKFSENYDKKTNINNEYVSQEIGRFKGGLETAVKRMVSEYGVEFQTDEVKDKKLEDIIRLSLNKIVANSESAIQKVKEESRKTKPAEIQEWEIKVSKLSDKIGQLESVNAAIKDDMAKKESEYLAAIKNTKLGMQEQALWGNLKLRHDIDDLTKKGFETYIREKYRFNLDDKDTMVILDSEGKFIPDSTKHGAFRTPQQVIYEEAVAKNLIERNPDAGKRVGNNISVFDKSNQGGNSNAIDTNLVRSVSSRRAI